MLAASAQAPPERLLSPEVASAVRQLLARDDLRPYTLARGRVRSCNDQYLVCRLDDESGGRARPSVIVKAPVRRRPSTVDSINHEVRAMRYLHGLADRQLSQLAPAIHAHDPRMGVVIMEDLVASRQARSLHDTLCAARSAEALACLALLARTLARLHRDTQYRLNDPTPGPREWSIVTASFDRTARRFRRVVQRFGQTWDGAIARELEDIHQLLNERSAKAFCHGDVNPENVFVSASGVHLCDFELSGLQHPVLEGLPAGWLFPVSVDAGGVPAEIVDALRAIYLRERGCPSGQDLARLEAVGLIAFSVYHWVHTWPDAGVPIAMAGARTKVLDLARRLDASAVCVYFPALSRVLRRLRDALARQGALAPDTSLPYACFLDGASVAADTAPRDEGFTSARGRHTGIFRVNPSCHLLVKRSVGERLAVYVLERPAIHGTAYVDAGGVLQAIEMPLRLTPRDRTHAVIHDVRTGKATSLRRRRLVPFAVRHLALIVRFLRYYYWHGRAAERNADG